MSGPAAGRLTFECHGVLVAVEPADAAMLDVLRPLLPATASPTPGGAADATYTWEHALDEGGGRLHVVATRGRLDSTWEEVARIPDAGEAADLLARDVEYRIALNARRRLFVHAAAVAWEGRVILVPGRSFSGKTTLAAALVRNGAAYLSDEYAVLDESGLAHPFPRRLRLRDASGSPAGRCSAEELGGTTASQPLPVGLVVWTRFRPGADWRPQRMSEGQSALALLGNTVVSRLRPAFALQVISRALVDAIGLRGPRGGADETALRILERASSMHAARS